MSARSTLEFSPGAAGPLLAAAEDASWRDAALCAQADPETWFPPKGGSTREAKKICRRCPSVAPCLEFALENSEQWGIWAGTTERERRAMRRTGRHSRPEFREAA